MKIKSIVVSSVCCAFGLFCAEASAKQGGLIPLADASDKSTAAIGDVPIVIKTIPANGACNVDPKSDKVVITFDRPMSGGYSFCRGIGANWNHHPETVERPSWNSDRTQITFHVKLRSGWEYVTCLNRNRANAFRSKDGTPLMSYPFVFKTSGKPEPLTDVPHVAGIEPVNGAKDVPPSLKEIRVTFDRKMYDGCWTVCPAKNGSRDDFPKIEGKMHYDGTCKVLTIPVVLQPKKTYKLQLNNGDACAFQDVDGKSLEDYFYTFTTKDVE